MRDFLGGVRAASLRDFLGGVRATSWRDFLEVLEQRRQLLVGAAVLFCRATVERRKAAQWQANVSRSRQERGGGPHWGFSLSFQGCVLRVFLGCL